MVGIFDEHVLKSSWYLSINWSSLKKMKTKKISQKKSAVTMWQHIYVSNKHVLDYDVNVIFADLNEV